jgi:hypothetical protein
MWCRTPVVDIILEELIYNNNILSSLLQALSLSLPLYTYITLTNMVFPFKHSELEMKTQIMLDSLACLPYISERKILQLVYTDLSLVFY